jgi:hypothetical protein
VVSEPDREFGAYGEQHNERRVERQRVGQQTTKKAEAHPLGGGPVEGEPPHG